MDSTDCDLEGVGSLLFEEPIVAFDNVNFNGIKVAAPANNNNSLMSHYVWGSAIALSVMIDAGVINLEGKTCIELGAGAALPSLIAIAKKCKHAVVTDHCDVPLLAANATCLSFNWGSDIGPLGEYYFDVILGADILWLPDQHDALIKSLNELSSRTTDIYLAFGLHSGIETIKRFFEKCNFNHKCIAVISIPLFGVGADGTVDVKEWWNAVQRGLKSELCLDDISEDITERLKYVLVYHLRV